MGCLGSAWSRLLKCVQRGSNLLEPSGAENDNRSYTIFCCVCNKQLRVEQGMAEPAIPQIGSEIEIAPNTSAPKRRGKNISAAVPKKGKKNVAKEPIVPSEYKTGSCCQITPVALHVQRAANESCCQLTNGGLKVYINSDFLIGVGDVHGGESARTHVFISPLQNPSAAIYFPVTDLCCFISALQTLW